jgi:hypothetical protein
VVRKNIGRGLQHWAQWLLLFVLVFVLLLLTVRVRLLALLLLGVLVVVVVLLLLLLRMLLVLARPHLLPQSIPQFLLPPFRTSYSPFFLREHVVQQALVKHGCRIGERECDGRQGR